MIFRKKRTFLERPEKVERLKAVNRVISKRENVTVSQADQTDSAFLSFQ